MRCVIAIAAKLCRCRTWYPGVEGASATLRRWNRKGGVGNTQEGYPGVEGASATLRRWNSGVEGAKATASRHI